MVRNRNGIRGIQKRMIVLKTAESRYFDEAYFLIRREAEPREELQTDMLAEAEKILRGCISETVERPKRSGWKRLLLFLAGAFCGAGVGILTFFLTHR